MQAPVVAICSARWAFSEALAISCSEMSFGDGEVSSLMNIHIFLERYSGHKSSVMRAWATTATSILMVASVREVEL